MNGGVGRINATTGPGNGGEGGGKVPTHLLPASPDYSRVGLVRSLGAVRAGSTLISLALCSCLFGVVEFADLFTGGGASMAAALVGGSLLLGVGIWQANMRGVEAETIAANMLVFSLVGAGGGVLSGFLISKLAATGITFSINILTALGARFADPKYLPPIIFGPIQQEE